MASFVIPDEFVLPQNEARGLRQTLRPCSQLLACKRSEDLQTVLDVFAIREWFVSATWRLIPAKVAITPFLTCYFAELLSLPLPPLACG